MLAEDIRHPEKQPIVFERRSEKIQKTKKKKKTKEGGTDLHLGKGVLKRDISKHQETFSVPSLC